MRPDREDRPAAGAARPGAGAGPPGLRDASRRSVASGWLTPGDWHGDWHGEAVDAVLAAAADSARLTPVGAGRPV